MIELSAAILALVSVGIFAAHALDDADAGTGLALATLTLPEPANFSWLAFDSSGTRLAVTREGLDVVVWDLARLHERLANAGLAWAPGQPMQQANAVRSSALRVDRGHLPRSWADKVRGSPCSRAWAHSGPTTSATR